MVAIFFDLEKAFDTAWKYGILNDLYDCGLRGELPCFVENFLSDRTFKNSFRLCFVWLIFSGEWCSSREHSFSRFIYIKNQLYNEMH